MATLWAKQLWNSKQEIMLKRARNAFVMHCNRKGGARFSGRLSIGFCKFFSVRSVSKHRDLEATVVTEIYSQKSP